MGYQWTALPPPLMSSGWERIRPGRRLTIRQTRAELIAHILTGIRLELDALPWDWPNARP